MEKLKILKNTFVPTNSRSKGIYKYDSKPPPNSIRFFVFLKSFFKFFKKALTVRSFKVLCLAA